MVAAGWLYAGGLLALWLLILLTADRWWAGTVAMYGPRWVWAVPLIPLLPATGLYRTRGVWLPLGLSVLLLLGPVMGLCVPWRRALPRGTAVPTLALRVVTLNSDNQYFDAAAFRRWIQQVRPDVVVLQDCRARDRRAIFGPADDSDGWYGRKDGELVVESRFPITACRTEDPARFDAGHGGTLAAYDLQTPAGTVRLLNVHTSTPRYALLAVAARGPNGAGLVRENTERRRHQLETVRQWADGAVRTGTPVIVAGDLNTPPDSSIYRRSWSDFANAFSSAGFGFGNTHFTRHTAVRIDHVLAGPGWRFRRAWVGPFVGSGHRPIVADGELYPSGR